MTTKIHKYTRKYKPFRQFRRCDGKRATGAENVAYEWHKVTCRKCLVFKPKGKRK